MALKTDPIPVPVNAEFITVRQAADILQVSPRTIFRMVERGEMPQPLRWNSKLTRFRLADLRAWIDAQEQLPLTI